MDVLHVITRYLTGGSERRIRDAIEATPELSHAVVVGAEHNPERLGADLSGVAVEVMPSLVRNVSPKHDLAAYRALSARIRRHRPRLVHTHQSKAGVLGRLAARRLGITAVHSLSMANFGPGFGRAGSAVFRNAERFLASSTAGYAVVGHDLKQRFVGLGIPEAKFDVVRSSIELASFEAAAASPTQPLAEFDLPAGAKVLVYAGRFEELKGVRDLPLLLERLGPHQPVLVLAGDGPLRTEVVQQCRALTDVVELGYTNRMPEVLAAADVVVLPSRAEGVPQVLVQSLAAGRPFAAFAADGAGELAALPGADACRVVPIGDIDALAGAVAALLDADAHPKVDLREWSTAAVHAGYQRLYARVLGADSP